MRGYYLMNGPGLIMSVVITLSFYSAPLAVVQVRFEGCLVVRNAHVQGWICRHRSHLVCNVLSATEPKLRRQQGQNACEVAAGSITPSSNCGCVQAKYSEVPCDAGAGAEGRDPAVHSACHPSVQPLSSHVFP